MFVKKMIFSWRHSSLPRWLGGKDSMCQYRDMGSIPGSERSHGEGKWQPTPVFLPGKNYEQRSLLGYSPQGCKESDKTIARRSSPDSNNKMYESLNSEKVWSVMDI